LYFEYYYNFRYRDWKEKQGEHLKYPVCIRCIVNQWKDEAVYRRKFKRDEQLENSYRTHDHV